MVLERVKQAFFVLLRAGLWGRLMDDLSCFPLAEAEWQALYEISKQHRVEGILFDALPLLDAACCPPRPLLLQWCVRVEKIEQRNHWMNQLLAEQSTFFAQQDLQPLLLKGQGLAHCYRHPEHRIGGDIDWCFTSREAYLAANKLVASQGIALKYVAGYSACYQWKGCEIDHHQKLFDLHNPFLRAYLQGLVRQEQAQRLELQGASVYLPAPILQMLQVNTHILKHLLSFGIGLRQLCDAARLYTVYKEQVDGVDLKAVYRKTGILKWMLLLHQLLVDYIGLPPADLPFAWAEKPQGHWMMDEIWQAGDFGFYDVSGGKGPRSGTQGSRSKRKLWTNFKKYLPYAPMEAMSFPLVHFYSGFSK